METPLVSLVTPHHNRLEYLIKCIDSFKRHNRDFLFEHIIIDNASHDGTKQWFSYIHKIGDNPRYGSWWDHVRYVRNGGNCGDHEAKQQGIKLAKGQYIMTTDNDTEIEDDDFFKKLIDIYEFLIEGQNVGAIMPRRWLCKTVIPIQNAVNITFPFGEVICGRIPFGPVLFYRRDVMPHMPHIGRPEYLVGKEIWKIWTMKLLDQDYGTGSLTRVDSDLDLQKYGWGDQGHKYPNYFPDKKVPDGCVALENL